MEKGNKNHHFTKWDFDMTSREVDNNWKNSTGRAT